MHKQTSHKQLIHYMKSGEGGQGEIETKQIQWLYEDVL